MPLADIPPLRPPRRAKKPAALSQGPADPGATTTLSGGAETRAGPSNATSRKATPASIASEHAAPDSSGIQTAREPTSDERRSGKWGEGRSVATLQVNVALALK